MMEKIASFSIDHVKLQPGIYVSRKDKVGDQVITTFDLRMTSPNEEPVMNTAELHPGASGGNLSEDIQRTGGQGDLLRAHGLQDRMLFPDGRGLWFQGHP